MLHCMRNNVQIKEGMDVEKYVIIFTNEPHEYLEFMILFGLLYEKIYNTKLKNIRIYYKHELSWVFQ